MEKIMVLSPEEILKKRFKVAFKGYDAEEVDSLLDKVILDYRTMLDYFYEIHKDKENLSYKIKSLESELQTQQNKNSLLEQQVSSLIKITNVNKTILDFDKVETEDVGQMLKKQKSSKK